VLDGEAELYGLSGANEHDSEAAWLSNLYAPFAVEEQGYEGEQLGSMDHGRASTGFQEEAASEEAEEEEEDSASPSEQAAWTAERAAAVDAVVTAAVARASRPAAVTTDEADATEPEAAMSQSVQRSVLPDREVGESQTERADEHHEIRRRMKRRTKERNSKERSSPFKTWGKRPMKPRVDFGEAGRDVVPDVDGVSSQSESFAMSSAARSEAGHGVETSPQERWSLPHWEDERAEALPPAGAAPSEVRGVRF